MKMRISKKIKGLRPARPAGGSRRWLEGLLSLLLVLYFVQGLLAASYLNKRVRINFKDGRPPITGVVTGEKDDGSLTLKFASGGTAIYTRAVIGNVELLKQPAEEFRERSAKCKTADDWVKLARWCAEDDIQLPEKRKECLAKAIELSPDHAEARQELGHIKVGGKWMDEEAANKAQGKIKVGGKWV